MNEPMLILFGKDALFRCFLSGFGCIIVVSFVVVAATDKGVTTSFLSSSKLQKTSATLSSEAVLPNVRGKAASSLQPVDSIFDVKVTPSVSELVDGAE